MVRPIPKCKRILGEANMLPHVVQLLLTFDPQIVEKVVQLLNLIVEVGRGGVGGPQGLESTAAWAMFPLLRTILSCRASS